MPDIDLRILELVAECPGLRGKDIAERLGEDRQRVNKSLYGSLRGQVRQDRSYRWTLSNPSGVNSNRQAQRAATRTAQLFAYYLDCLRYDDDSGVSVFAEGTHGPQDYVELESVPVEIWDQGQALSWTTYQPLQRLTQGTRLSKKRLALSVGYPILVRSVTGKSGWHGRFLEPICFWPLEEVGSSTVAVEADAQINTRALRSLLGDENPVEASAILAAELGIDSAGGALDELMLRLRHLCEHWPWEDEIDPGTITSEPPIAHVRKDGIYNRVAIFATERSPYTVGLERELHDLQAIPDSQINQTALGCLLGDQPRISPPTLAKLLLEPVPLNTEQRDAVERSLHQPITVITGPPGTGKSQVVSAIVTNAAYDGQRVLFASKNHKAVAVVLDRVNSLTIRPSILQLGSRSLQEALADHISGVLSSKTTEEDTQALERSQRQLSGLTEQNNGLRVQLDTVILQRNSVDSLERSFDPDDSRDPEDRPSPLADDWALKLKKIDSEVQAASDAATCEGKPLIWLIWPFVRKRRLEVLDRVVREAQEVLNAYSSARKSLEARTLLERARFILAVLKVVFERDAFARKYDEELRRLQTMKTPEAIAKDRLALIEAVADVSTDLWQAWQSTISDKLGPRERKTLGDYASLLRTIARTQNEGGTVAANTWRHYYQTASMVSKILSCWAVTSLSARGRIPLEPGVFDILIIDEASQCDIASALPLLYRAKRAVIIGDPQQLRHISAVKPEKDRQLLDSHGILDWPGAAWAYSNTSLYDLCQSRVSSDEIIALRDHHRSHEDIIGFSNRHFYQGRLRVATRYDSLRRPSGAAVRWIDVVGEAVRPRDGGAYNAQEAQAVVRLLHELVFKDHFQGDIGVVTPFRAQANRIRELVAKDNDLFEALARRNFLAETAHRFQGDERDVMIFSPVVSSGMRESTLRFLRSTGNIFNVAATRGRAAFWVVGDRAACRSSGVAHLEAYVKYADELSNRDPAAGPARSLPARSRDFPPVARPELVSQWERKLYLTLYDVGIRAIPQYEVDQYILDFALFADNGRRLDIEVDGERYHRDWDGELVRRDQIRNMRLTEMGWDIMRMWVYEIRDREADVVRRISSWLSENRSDTSEEPNDHGGLDTEGRLSTVKKPLRQRKKSIK